MILQKFNKKLQSGGGMSAQTEYIPLDITLNAPDQVVQPSPIVRLPEENLSMYEKVSGTVPFGLESDRKVYYDKVQKLRNDIRTGFESGMSDEELDTKQNELKYLLDSAYQLKEKETRYKELQNTANKSKGDLAYYDGRVLAYDRFGKKYGLVDVDIVATSGVTNKEGKRDPRYQLLTVGQALELRATNPTLHGIDGGPGNDVEEVIHSVTGVGPAMTNIRNAFKSVGYNKIADSNLVSINNAETGELGDYLESLLTGSPDKIITKEVIQKNAVKSNAANLENARNALLATVSNSDKEALRGQALNDYMQQYGSSTEAPDPKEWIENKVDYYVNQVMLSYLKQENLTGLGKSSGSGSKGSGTEQSMELNPLTGALRGDTKETITIQPPVPIDSKSTTQPQIQAIVTAMPLDWMKIGEKDNGNVVSKSVPMIMNSAGALEDNLILPSEENVQLTDGDPNILNKAAIDHSRNSQIIHNLPVYEENGKWNIAWGLTRSPEYKAIEKSVKENVDAEGLGMNEYRNRLQAAVRSAQEDSESDVYKILGGKNIQFRSVAKYNLIVATNVQAMLRDTTRSRIAKTPWGRFFSTENRIHQSGKDSKILEAIGWTGDIDLGDEIYKVSAYSVLKPEDVLTLQSKEIYKGSNFKLGEYLQLQETSQSGK